jgi:hypothetical protein
MWLSFIADIWLLLYKEACPCHECTAHVECVRAWAGTLSVACQDKPATEIFFLLFFAFLPIVCQRTLAVTCWGTEFILAKNQIAGMATAKLSSCCTIHHW